MNGLASVVRGVARAPEDASTNAVSAAKVLESPMGEHDANGVAREVNEWGTVGDVRGTRSLFIGEERGPKSAEFVACAVEPFGQDVNEMAENLHAKARLVPEERLEITSMQHE